MADSRPTGTSKAYEANDRLCPSLVACPRKAASITLLAFGDSAVVSWALKAHASVDRCMHSGNKSGYVLLLSKRPPCWVAASDKWRSQAFESRPSVCQIHGPTRLQRTLASNAAQVATAHE